MSRRIWRCTPPLVFCLIDSLATLLGQPVDYWQGHYGFAQQTHPWLAMPLESGPGAFGAAVLAWMLVFTTVLCVLPRRAAMVLSSVLVMAHAWGVSTWLCWRVPGGYWITLLLYLLAGWSITAAWNRE
jgi:hypothetical protein